MAALGEGALEVTLSLVGLAFPAALPFIVIAKEAIPAIIAAKPYILAAVQNGESAFAAAEKASPDLGAQIRKLAPWLPSKGASASEHLDNVTLATVGFAVPGWTDAETQKWIDNASPKSQDSTFGG